MLRHRSLVIGCLTVMGGFLLLTACALIWFLPGIPGTRRIPHEIVLRDLLQAQENALNPGWGFKPRSTLTDDSDLTHGAWVYEALFERTDSPYKVWLKFHSFRSPFLAERRFPPAQIYFDFEEGGDPPIGWSYVPPHADRFIIDCTTEEVPESCSIFTVYQEYSLVYRVDVAGAMTLEDLQRMLEATDQFMADFLENTSLVRGRRSIPTLSELGIQPNG